MSKNYYINWYVIESNEDVDELSAALKKALLRTGKIEVLFGESD